MDVHEPEIRSYNMSRIRSKDTKPEMLIRKFLFAKGFRYRLHVNKLPGRPDIGFGKLMKVILIHGCFWHGHAGCRYFVERKTRTSWRLIKINGNKDRDTSNLKSLKRLGWKAIVIFECDLKNDKRENTFKKVLKFLKK